MFDIGFSELFLIGIVALIVIGPERLPKVARTAGHLFGRMQRYVNDVKADINREMELDELRKMKTQFESAAREVETSVNREVNAVSSEVQAAQDAFAKDAAAAEPAPAAPAAVPAPAASTPSPGAAAEAAPRIPGSP
jgi:sec-independent protein translocase protein TatB